MGIVPAADWDLSQLRDDQRRERLLQDVPPVELVEQLAMAGREALQSHQIILDWQVATDETAPTKTFRVVTQIPVDELFFDQLFNGRCGYRTQYYLSPEEGEAFNRLIVEALEPIVCGAIAGDFSVPRSLISKSMLGPYSKVWPFEEQAAFDAAEAGILMPPRWKSYAGRGTRLPLANHLDVKGTFIKQDGEPWVDPIKLTRPADLHTCGYT